MENRLIDRLLTDYGESHQNLTNKSIHWICVPLIMFSLFGLLLAIPFPATTSLIANWATLFLLFALIYYFRLSLIMALSFIFIGGSMVYFNYKIFEALQYGRWQMLLVSFSIFAISWAGQFIGHQIEGKKPSFLKDLQFLLIGPAWLLHFIFKKLNIPY